MAIWLLLRMLQKHLTIFVNPFVDDMRRLSITSLLHSTQQAYMYVMYAHI